jgi:hypothetical protein
MSRALDASDGRLVRLSRYAACPQSEELNEFSKNFEAAVQAEPN